MSTANVTVPFARHPSPLASYLFPQPLQHLLVLLHPSHDGVAPDDIGDPMSATSGLHSPHLHGGGSIERAPIGRARVRVQKTYVKDDVGEVVAFGALEPVLGVSPKGTGKARSIDTGCRKGEEEVSDLFFLRRSRRARKRRAKQKEAATMLEGTMCASQRSQGKPATPISLTSLGLQPCTTLSKVSSFLPYNLLPVDIFPSTSFFSSSAFTKSGATDFSRECRGPEEGCGE